MYRVAISYTVITIYRPFRWRGIQKSGVTWNRHAINVMTLTADIILSSMFAGVSLRRNISNLATELKTDSLYTAHLKKRF